MGNELSQGSPGGTEDPAFQPLEECTENEGESADGSEITKEFITGLQGIVDNLFSLVSKPDDQEQCHELRELRNSEASETSQHCQTKCTTAERPKGILSPDFLEKVRDVNAKVLSQHFMNQESEHTDPTKTEQVQAQMADGQVTVDKEVATVLISEDYQVIFRTLMQNITAGMVSKEFSEWSDTPKPTNRRPSPEDTSSRTKPWAYMNNAVVYEKEMTEVLDKVLGINKTNEFAGTSDSTGKDECSSQSDDKLTRGDGKPENPEEIRTNNSETEATVNPFYGHFADSISLFCSILTSPLQVDDQLTENLQESEEPEALSLNSNKSDGKEYCLMDILASIFSNLTFDKEPEHPDAETATAQSTSDNIWKDSSLTDLVEEFKLNAAECLSGVLKDFYMEPWRPHVQNFFKDKEILERAAELRSTNLPIDRKLHEIHRTLQTRGNKKVHPRDTLRMNKLKQVRDVQMASNIFQDIQKEERDAEKYGVDSYSWEEEPTYDEQDENELPAEVPNTADVYFSSGRTTEGVVLGNTHVTPESKTAMNGKPQTSPSVAPQDISVEVKAGGSIKAVVIGNTSIEAESDDVLQIGCSVTTLKGMPEEMKTLK